MIYFLYGSDTEKARAKAHELVDALRGKKPDAELFRLDPDTWTAEEAERLIAGAGLFQNNYIVFLNGVLENPDAEEFALERAADLEASPNVFILLAGELKKAVRDKLEKKASKTQAFEAAKAPEREFNNFALAEALGKRDKKGLWVLFCQAMNEGKAPEELHGMLFWQAKSMLQALNAKTPAESGLKPFVHSKSLRYAGNYTRDELVALSSGLVSIYHESRRGGEDLDVALEKFVLNI